jgi:hypothetical protein
MYIHRRQYLLQQRWGGQHVGDVAVVIVGRFCLVVPEPLVFLIELRLLRVVGNFSVETFALA